MRGFSKAIITGNLTRDPEVRTTTSGSQVCGFTVAVNRIYKDSTGVNQEAVSFIDCSAWGKPGEVIAQYAKKGTGILVSGRLEQRSWDDKETGKKRSRTEIVVEDFNFMGGGDRSSNNSESAGNSVSATETTGDIVPEDIPEEPINITDVPF